MLVDFGALPPEINSTWMYTGPGPGPMMAAAAAWNNLAAELTTTASAYESVISELTGGPWVGPSSAVMAAATEPYIGWMNITAAAVEHAASQAMASAAAYEAAFAMTVPPAQIAANRAQLAALVATNFLGVNTPAIMATEASYAQMWVQDAVAMYGYQVSSASAASLNPLTSPTQTTNPVGPGAQAAAVSQAAVQPVASPLAGSAESSSAGLVSSTNGFLNDLVGSGSNIGIWNDAYSITGLIGGVGSSGMFQAVAGGVSHGVSQSASAAAGAVVPPSFGTILAGTAGPAAQFPAGRRYLWLRARRPRSGNCPCRQRGRRSPRLRLVAPPWSARDGRPPWKGARRRRSQPVCRPWPRPIAQAMASRHAMVSSPG